MHAAQTMQAGNTHFTLLCGRYNLEYEDGDQEEVSPTVLNCCSLLCCERSTVTLSSKTQQLLAAVADQTFNQDTALLVPAEIVQRANGGDLTGLLGESANIGGLLPGTASVLYEAEGWGWTVEAVMRCGGERIVAPLAAVALWVAPPDYGEPPLVTEAVAALSPINPQQAALASRVRFAGADKSSSSKRSRVTYVERDSIDD